MGSSTVYVPWTDYEDDFIKRNTNHLSNKDIAFLLGRTLEAISTRKKKLRIIKDKKDIISDFLSLTPNLAYVLGFLFGDGSVSNTELKSTKNYSVCLKIHPQDKVYINNSFLLVSKEWKIKNYLRSNGQQTLEYNIVNKELHNFFYYDLDYKHKNNYISNKIFGFLPENLHRYWWRGYFDADGCIYVPKTKGQSGIRLYWAAPYDFDWSALKRCCDSMEVEYGIKLQTNHTGGWSHFYIHKIYHVEKFVNYLYSSVGVDGIGFTRKYIKFIEYIEKRNCLPKSKYSNQKNTPKMYFDINGVSNSKGTQQCSTIIP